MTAPETRYAKSAHVHIAYQAAGTGRLDLVYVPGWVSNVESMWDPLYALFLVGARIAGIAGPGEVLVSSTVKDLVAGSGIAVTERGEHRLKGVPDAWRLFSIDRV